MRMIPMAVTVTAALWLAPLPPAYAASLAEIELKADIDGALKKLEAATNGIFKWEDADRIEIRPDGDGAIAEITNARIALGAGDAKPARLSLDHVEIRRSPAPDNGIALAVVFPRQVVVRGADGAETRLTLRDATAKLVLDAPSGRARATEIAAASGRLEDKKTGDWLSFDALTASSKLAGTADGGWTAPLDFELKGIEFFFVDGPVAGLVERIAYGAQSAGPDLAALNGLRDRLDALRASDDVPLEARLGAVLDLLPGMSSLFSVAKGEFSIERLVARAPTGEPLVAFDKASMGGGLTGMSGDTAALRITLKHDGLVLAPTILDKNKVPQRVVLDIGLEEVETGPLRSIIEAVKNKEPAPQMLAAAAQLHPVLRIYDLAVDLPETGVAGSAEAKGSPLAPQGYTAQGDVAIRGFDALASLVGAAPLAEYLPLLRELGTAATGPDGTPRVAFRLASAPPKWLTLNGNDVSAWLGGKGDPAAALLLRPAAPAITGKDVSAVQRALAAAKIAAPQNGTYDGATAVAVARFQKQAGLNVNGVVDAATWQKLGVKPEPAKPAEPRRPPGRAN